MSDDEIPHPRTDMEIAEAYAAESELEAERIVLLLGDEGIEAFKREVSVSVIPTVAGLRFLVLVFAENLESTNKILTQAREDGILSDTGAFL